jgi:large subunit ribosomal protein L32
VAVPKRKMSRANTRSRRAQWKATPVQLAPCPNRACRQLKPPQVACPTCGQYAGRQVVSPA